VAEASEAKPHEAFVEWATAALAWQGPEPTLGASWPLFVRVLSAAGQPLGAPCGAVHHPELAVAYFRALTALAEPPLTQPRLLAEAFTAGLATAVQCLDATDKEAGKAVLGFLRAAAQMGGEGGLLRDLLAQQAGAPVMCGLLTGVCGAMPCWMLDELVATMVAFCVACGRELVCRCVARGLPPVPRSQALVGGNGAVTRRMVCCAWCSMSAGSASPSRILTSRGGT
jgi:hypothetical protein